MTTKHTPETWKHIRDIGSGKINIWADDGNEWIGEVEDMSDARLIAAAPDLLGALEDMINHCQGCNGRGRCYGRVPGSLSSYAPNQPCQDCGDARAAIAKAKGEK